jgi:hypothetical protein
MRYSWGGRYLTGCCGIADYTGDYWTAVGVADYNNRQQRVKNSVVMSGIGWGDTGMNI